MKLVRTEILVSAGEFPKSQEWADIQQEIIEAVTKVVWPTHSQTFTIFPERGKERGKGNGVKPIKEGFQIALEKRGWELEKRLPVVKGLRPGPIDVVRETSFGRFAVEWETGNISSSHRALNKMAVGMLQGSLIGGVLVVPTRDLYEFLTDRVGNYRELEPYFPVWRDVSVENGLLAVVAVEHDATSMTVPRINKGTDGRALV